MWKNLSFKFLTRYLLILALLLLVVWLIISLVNAPLWGDRNVRVEKIVEKQVYLESSATIMALQTFRQSVLTVISREKLTSKPLSPVALRTLCDEDWRNCGELAVLLTSDGLVLAADNIGGLPVKDLVAIDHEGQLYELFLQDNLNGYVILQLVREGEGDLAPEKRTAFFNLTPVNLSSGDSLAVGQRLLILRHSLAGNNGLVESMITSISHNDQFLLELDGGLAPIQFQHAAGIGKVGELLFDLQGQLMGVTLAENEILTADQVASLLTRLAKGSGNIAPVNLGLRCLRLNKELAAGLGLKVDYGCLVTDGVEANFQLLGSGVTKGGMAESLGLRNADQLLEIDNRSLWDASPMVVLSGKVHDENIQLTVLRGDEKIVLNGNL